MEQAALCYKETSNFQRNGCVKLFDKLAPEPGSRILDLGCGTGYLANLLAERVGPQGKVVAVDPDPARIKVAMETYGGKSNLEFAVASDADFPVDQYDIVVSTFVVHWIEDKDALFKRVFDNLKPGGCFALTIGIDCPPCQEVLTELFQAFGQEMVDATQGKLHFRSAADYKHLATSNGFDIEEIVVDEHRVEFPTIENFIDFFFAGSHGRFDRSSSLLDDYKKKYEGQQILPVLWLTAILKKPAVTN